MSVLWGVVTEIGFWGWCLTTIGFLLVAFPARSAFSRVRATCWGIPLFLFYLIWVAGMLNA